MAHRHDPRASIVRPLHLDDLREFERFSESLADGILVTDATGVVVAANARIEQMTGYSRDELVGKPVEVLVPAHLRERHVSARDAYSESPHVRPIDSSLDLWLRRKDGTDVAVDIGLSPLALEDRRYVVAAVWDATERRREEEERLGYREAILGAAAFAASRFLRGDRWQTHIDDVLARLGEAGRLSRVSLHLHHTDAGGDLVTSHRHEWCSPGVDPQIGNPALRNVPLRDAGRARWSALMEAGELVHGKVDDLPDDERPMLEMQGIRSFLSAPVVVDGQWWGDIVFVDCEHAREWTAGERDALRTAADTLGAGVERQQTHERLQAGEERFRLLAENAQDMIFRYRLWPALGFEYVSPSVTTITGYTPEELYSDPELVLRLVHPDDQHIIQEGFAALAEGRESAAVRSSTLRWVRKGGEVRWTEQRTTPIYDEANRLVTIEGIARDVTDQKLADQELRDTVELLRRTDQQRRALLSQLVAAQEAERERIAEDIHDDSIQQMTAASLRAQILRGKLHEPEQMTLLDQLAGQIQSAIERLRRMLFELRPPELDTEGIAGALRHYLTVWSSEWEGDSPVEYQVEDRMDDEPPSETRAVAYRIAQEALVNVGKHARARRVDVLLETRDSGVAVTVRDDGVGFAAGPDLESRPGHIGLSALRERAEMAGGRLAVRSATGQGTTVEFWLPVEPTGRS